MAKPSCDGCGRTITIAGGMANLWAFGPSQGTEGTAMTLEFDDGSTYLLCFPCIEALPDNPTAADVETLDPHDHDSEGA